jgi:microcystin-dependent protein
MPYEILFTDYVNKLGIVVEDGTINQETSLKIPGRNSTAYGTVIAENFLHLLENFASPTEPTVPVEGQLWYDSSPETEGLKVYNGVNWEAVNGVNKSVSAPEYKQEGDLWIDRENLQLYMYTDAGGWILIGPQFQEGTITGATPKVLTGIDDINYNVLQIDINAMPSMIISSYEFTPKVKIPGFITLKPGFNMTSNTETGQQTLKYYGIAEKAESLFINNATVPAGNFLRGDQVSSTSYHLNVQNNTGINYGRNAELNIGVEGQTGVIKSNVAGSSIDINVKHDGLFKTLTHFDSSEFRVGVGNISPQEMLDVSGNIRVSPSSTDALSGNLKVESTVNSTRINEGSIVTSGGVGIALSTTIGENLQVGLVGFDYNNGQIEARRLVPDKDTDEIIAGPSYIGTADLRYGEIHSKKFIGDLTGTVTGSVSGRAGSANRLATASTFRFTGDVELGDEVTFIGQGGLVEFPTIIGQGFISTKDGVQAPQTDDELLLNRIRNDIGVKKISDQNLLSIVPTMPVGSVIPYAGIEAPEGWLFCDGLEYSRAEYDLLYAAIGSSYGAASIGKFKVPDMRGRFPLGSQAMGANPVASTPVTGANMTPASTIGALGGSSTKGIAEENLPDHKHNLKGDGGVDGSGNPIEGEQYYAMAQSPAYAVNDIGSTQYPFYKQTSNFDGIAVPNTGGVETTGSLAQPLDTMNPFSTLNYIIYAGRII